MMRKKAEKAIMDAVREAITNDDMLTLTRIAARLTNERVVEQAIRNALTKAVEQAEDRDLELARRFIAGSSR